MTHTRANKGVCSSRTTVQLAPGGVILDVQVDDGCEGNLRGMCLLLKGRSAREAAGILRGTHCENKKTSCPDQIALCLQEALDAQEQE